MTFKGEPAAFEAIPDPTALSGNELGKSRSTRRRILDAATACLAENGYRRFSTGAVAARAGLTRPAMLYHFGSRLELLTATTHHVVRRRVEMFEEALSNLPPPTGNPVVYWHARATELAWDQLYTPEFQAYTELVMVARTDKGLRSIVRPAIAAFDSARREVTERIFPQEAYDTPDYRLGRDVLRFLSEGAVQQQSLFENAEERLAALRHFTMQLASPAGIAFYGAVQQAWVRTFGSGESGPRDA